MAGTNNVGRFTPRNEHGMDYEKNDWRGEMWGKENKNAITQGRRTRKKDRAKKKQRNFMHQQRKSCTSNRRK